MRALLPVLLILWPAAGLAQGITRLGDEVYEPRIEAGVDVSGSLRLRGGLYYNHDLDRGLGPSGNPLYPVSVSDPSAQSLTAADMRLRIDMLGYTRGNMMGVSLRVDVLDNVPLGGDADLSGVVATQRTDGARSFALRRAFGHVQTPVGMLAAGRMSSSWGLGILANAGECADCDLADASDRVAFATPIASHVWAIAYDFTSTGPFTSDRAGGRLIDLDPGTNSQALIVAVQRFHTDLALTRRRRAGRWSGEYGMYFAHGWQVRDVAVGRLPVAVQLPPSPSQVQQRGLSVNSGSLWARLTSPSLRLEVEAVIIEGEIEQPSLIPGLVIESPVTLSQLGAALETEYGALSDPFSVGLDLGYASGDPASGFGAFPQTNAPAPEPGDLDGAQVDLVDDFAVDNFRFHPNYQIDRILFREIIGTVTDSVYARAHGHWEPWRNTNSALRISLAVIVSAALESASTPGRESLLGVEIDPGVSYLGSDGFELALEQATLIPLAGLDNPEQKLIAQPAQQWRLRLNFAF